MSTKKDTAAVQASLEMAFKEYGMPQVIRSDNGPPFASTGLLGLSQLCVWWIRLGIIPQRIRPGHPEENGRIERFHKTLKAEAIYPAQRTIRQQQRTFDHFLYEYNYQRPHEALGQTVPAEHYTASPRPYPPSLPRTPDYPDAWHKRTVKSSGTIKWKNHEVYITQALAGQPIALAPSDEGHYTLYYDQYTLGTLDEQNKTIRPGKR